MAKVAAMKYLSAVDYAVVVVLFAVSALIGLFVAWRDRRLTNNKHYLTGNNQLGILPVSLSLVASFLSSTSLLGMPSEVYRRGMTMGINAFAAVAALNVVSLVFVPVYYRLNLISVYKYLKLRFDSSAVRLAGSIGFILCTLPYMGVVLYGPSLALGSVTPLSVKHSILVVGLICTFYTSAGGIKAVVWTDVLQVLLMTAGFLLVIIQGCIEVGGLSEIFRIASEGKRLDMFQNMEVDIYSPASFWNVLIGTFITWGGTYGVKQTQVQRYCSMPSVKKAKLALYLNMLGLSILITMSCFCGIVLFGYYHSCDPVKRGAITKPDQLMPLFVMETLGHIPGIPGLFIAAVFSGSLSTLSSGFNALTAITWDDFLKHVCTKKEKKAMWITRSIAVFYGLLSVGIAFLVGRLGSVLEASISIAGAIAGPLLGIFILGVLFPFANGKGALSGIISGVSLSFWITAGTLIYPRPTIELSTSIAGCSPNVDGFAGTNITESPVHWVIYPEDYQRTGLLNLYHMSYLLISCTGFVVTILVGIIVSVATGCNEDVDPKLVNPLAKYICFPCAPRAWKAKRALKKRASAIDDESGIKLYVNPNACDVTGSQKKAPICSPDDEENVKLMNGVQSAHRGDSV